MSGIYIVSIEASCEFNKPDGSSLSLKTRWIGIFRQTKEYIPWTKQTVKS